MKDPRMSVLCVDFESNPPSEFNLKRGKVFRCILTGSFANVTEFLQAQNTKQAIVRAHEMCAEYNKRFFKEDDKRKRQELRYSNNRGI